MKYRPEENSKRVIERLIEGYASAGRWNDVCSVSRELTVCFSAYSRFSPYGPEWRTPRQVIERAYAEYKKGSSKLDDENAIWLVVEFANVGSLSDVGTDTLEHKLAILEDGLRDFPNSVEIITAIGDMFSLGGWSFSRSYYYKKAIEYYEWALRIDPNFAPARRRLEYVSKRIGRKSELEEELKKALELEGKK